MARPRGTKEQRQQAMRLATGAGKFIGYIRVSTSGQEQNGHSLEGQIARLRMTAEAEGLELVDIVQDVESGAKQRDGLDALWQRLRDGEAEGVLIMRLDRLGRSLAALAALVDEAKKLQASILAVDGGWQIRRGEVNGALPVLMGVAEMERDLISRRTREGLAAAKAKGVQRTPARWRIGQPHFAARGRQSHR
jgi:DNA invertase Pin-like site-specific DNA recombinase